MKLGLLTLFLVFFLPSVSGLPAPAKKSNIRADRVIANQLALAFTGSWPCLSILAGERHSITST